ncbi:MAG: hypothetical protein MZW92_69855 [Comamonadaceae bacterium]|nr:hypothetical protein [Comamonadaceae bacterium]
MAPALGPWGFGAAARGPAAGLGLQRAAGAAEAQRLVGQCRAAAVSYEGLAWVTGAAVMAGGAMPGATFAGAGRALQPRRARHHDAERLQVDRRATGSMGIGSLPVRLGVDGAARTGLLR